MVVRQQPRTSKEVHEGRRGGRQEADGIGLCQGSAQDDADTAPRRGNNMSNATMALSLVGDAGLYCMEGTA
jgi:hypothetical protein